MQLTPAAGPPDRWKLSEYLFRHIRVQHIMAKVKKKIFAVAAAAAARSFDQNAKR